MQILLAVDLSEPEALTRKALALTRRLDADLMVLHVSEPTPATFPTVDPISGFGDADPYASYDPELEEHIEKAREHAFHEFLVARFGKPVRADLKRGQPAETILEDAREHNVDLIILGKHHHGRLEEMLLGSVANKIVKKTTIPTLLIPIAKNE